MKTCPGCCKPVSGGAHTCVLPACCTTYADHVFVYGANARGVHGKGAALHALRHHRAMRGCGYGHYGHAFGIPTKDGNLLTLSLDEIETYVRGFLNYAAAHPEFRFYVTAIGTGSAGYSADDIAPMFADAPENCVLPEGWRR